ncbi:MAG TPA: DUF3592 domain-containing protein [Allosphingosinicella sp.]
MVVQFVMGAFGAWVTYQGLALLAARQRLTAQGADALGEVTGYKPSFGSGGVAYMPKVRFRAAQGEREFVSGMSANRKKWPVGTAVPVRYLPEDPAQAEIATGPRMWAPPLIFTLFGLFMMWAAARLAGLL